MFKFDEQQWQQLRAHDEKNFVAAVCDRFLEERLELRAAPGRAIVLDRMDKAYRYASDLGFRSTPHIVQFLYLAADAPEFYQNKIIDMQLRKPGATPEDRFDELMAVTKKLAEGGHSWQP